MSIGSFKSINLIYENFSEFREFFGLLKNFRKYPGVFGIFREF